MSDATQAAIGRWTIRVLIFVGCATAMGVIRGTDRALLGGWLTENLWPTLVVLWVIVRLIGWIEARRV